MIAREDFVSRFGGVFEYSPFIAERAYDQGLVEEPLTADGVHKALCTVFRAASDEERLGVLRKHPDLAGKLAVSGELTEESRREQAGAGLDRLSPEEHAEFTGLNSAYIEKFQFPFIIAVSGLNKDDILAAFKRRIDNSAEEELATACHQVEKIAGFRLQSLLAE
ncbi:2-oxo-4-hydroxy-4-carboxy-5-ureidoimidazoline decarboxylase [Martelella sp. AD-3]|uniref:2-oxo-4-hydroxy-4-carboxy-5-ureidoimidazoline decarboxylase n=1 Tax=Martelella sp. AD-3 TaxID=686597 RepID=UPI000466AB3C|nr:2-oxo-4-hydroxy-4-carboxy-5-ureidoimidazoline decarboxylase [Martelella sp. AD-3]AMM83596.1 OHCU decarboxylase [Martelella sp. AD-3]MAM11619.1 OHCU decarboxylase [Rhizobiaceae bacterium]